jgi:hypothetical protein
MANWELAESCRGSAYRLQRQTCWRFDTRFTDEALIVNGRLFHAAFAFEVPPGALAAKL